MPPKVSLILPAYNGEAFIEETLRSILGQTFEDFEALVVDDASTDATCDIVRSFHDPRIRLIRNAENLGIANCRNKGLGLARGVYIARTDQDDLPL